MIALSKVQRKNADRLAGLELMIPWPADLPMPELAEGEERDATAAETAAAHVALAPELDRLRLTIVRVVAVVDRPPGAGPRATRTPRPWLAVLIVGARWMAARATLTNPPPPLIAWSSAALAGCAT